MSDDIKQKKEELLIQLLKENPQLSMKDANVSIREAFDTGVAPPTFSKIKKSLFSGEEETPTDEVASPKKPKKAAKVKEALACDSDVEDLFDGSEAQKAKSEESSITSEPQLEPLLSDDDDSSESQPKKSPKDKRGPSLEEAQDNNQEEEDLREESSEREDAPPAPEEPEIDPNLPRHPVQLVVHAPKANQVHLAGSFNRWKRDELALEKGEHGLWHFSGELPEGTYEYKYIVDQKTWHLDMNLERVTDKTGVSHRIQIPQSAS